MRRNWRAGRILLAVLLVSLAALMAYLWPRQPRWQLPLDMMKESNHILSVDETRRHFYTRYMDFSSMEQHDRGQASPLKLVFEIRCYDLDTGKQAWRQPDPQDPVPPNEIFSIYNVVLSPDRSQSAYVKSHLGEVHLYDVPPRTKHAVIRFTDFSPGEHLSVSYSPLGDWLLARTDKQVFIYDSQTAKLIHQLDIPKEHIIEGGQGDWKLEQDGLLCSADKRYLVMTNNNVDNILVFDLHSKKMIGECKKMYLPRLLNDGKTLLSIPKYIQMDAKVRWYGLHESGIVSLPVSTSEIISGEYVCCNDKNFVTANLIPPPPIPFWYDWSWLSDTSKFAISQWLGLMKMEIEVSLWNSNTGVLEKRFPLVLSASVGLPTSGCRNWLLNDSSQMLLNVGTSIALWDLPPRRPLSCWLVVSSITALTLWLAWPRRVKKNASHVSINSA